MNIEFALGTRVCPRNGQKGTLTQMPSTPYRHTAQELAERMAELGNSRVNEARRQNLQIPAAKNQLQVIIL